MEPSQSSLLLPRFCKPWIVPKNFDFTAADWNSLKLVDLSLDLTPGADCPLKSDRITQTGSESKTVAKRIWKLTEAVISPSFVNQATCIVSFVWSPSKFTLTASVDISKIGQLSKAMEEYCDTAFPLVRVPAVDDIVFAPFEGEYFRACVENVSEATREVTVIFIDYGDRATVELFDCREPCDKIMTEYPVYGMIFTLNLNALVPPQLELNEDIMKIIDDNSMYLHICCCHSQDILSDPKLGWTGSLCMDVEGTQTLNSVIQNFILTSTSSALSAKPIKEPESIVVEIREIRKMFEDSKYSENLIKISEATMRVNCVWGNGNNGKQQQISISSTEDEADLDSLSELIAQYSETAPGMQRIPVMDEIVIAPYTEIESFYRGRVTAVNGDQVRVVFVDYGDEVEVNYSELKELPLEVAQMPMYGLTFQSTDDSPVSEQIAVNIRDIQVVLESKSNGHIDSKELGMPMMTSRNKVPEAKKLSKNRTTFHNLKMSKNLKHEAIVKINCFWNDGLVSIYALEDKAAMESLDELIGENSETAQSLLMMPELDEILLTPYDGVYYRGRVIDMTGDIVKLTFVDHGDETKVNYTELKELTSEIAKHPIYSVKFRMARVPETKHISEKNADLWVAVKSKGQIEVMETKCFGPVPGVVEELVGNLWVSSDRTWSDIVLHSAGF